MAAAIQIAKRHGVPVTARGAGTGLSGGAIPCEGGIVLVTARMDRILKLDPANVRNYNRIHNRHNRGR